MSENAEKGKSKTGAAKVAGRGREFEQRVKEEIERRGGTVLLFAQDTLEIAARGYIAACEAFERDGIRKPLVDAEVKLRGAACLHHDPLDDHAEIIAGLKESVKHWREQAAEYKRAWVRDLAKGRELTAAAEKKASELRLFCDAALKTSASKRAEAEHVAAVVGGESLRAVRVSVDEAIRREAAEAREAKLREALVWMSGASDFSPEGQCREAFVRDVLPLLSAKPAAKQ